jgi:hypothetical protein
VGIAHLGSELRQFRLGVSQRDVTQTLSNPAPFPSNPSPANSTQHQWMLNLSFPKNTFTSGKVLRFNVGRSQQQDGTVPQGMTTSVLVRSGDYSADIIGSGILIPEDPDGASVQPGMTFNGTVVVGSTTYPFSGRLMNKIGRGYSVLNDWD